jgi:hypothetical protein
MKEVENDGELQEEPSKFNSEQELLLRTRKEGTQCQWFNKRNVDTFIYFSILAVW